MGLISALGYTAANICLRATSHCDPIWVSCVKAVPTTVLLGLWLLSRAIAGKHIFPSTTVLAVLIATAFFMQVFGNVFFQWSLHVIGVALAAPMTMGAAIVTAALLGRLFLGELLTARTLVSVAILVAAIFILSLGAVDSNHATVPVDIISEASTFQKLLAVVAVCCAGFAYSAMGVAIRYSMANGGSIMVTIWTSGCVGVIGLGVLAVSRLGTEGILDTSWPDLDMMLRAGLLTTLAFFALAKSLELTTLVYINALNSSQAAMSALAGVWFFHEPSSDYLWFGIALTIVGLIFMDRRRQASQTSGFLDSPQKLSSDSSQTTQ